VDACADYATEIGQPWLPGATPLAGASTTYQVHSTVEFPPCCSFWTSIGQVVYNLRYFDDTVVSDATTGTECGTSLSGEFLCSCANYKSFSYEFATAGTLCSAYTDLIWSSDACVDAARSWNVGQPWAGLPITSVTDPSMPYGCSLRVSTQTLVHNTDTTDPLLLGGADADMRQLCLLTVEH